MISSIVFWINFENFLLSHLHAMHHASSQKHLGKLDGGAADSFGTITFLFSLPCRHFPSKSHPSSESDDQSVTDDSSSLLHRRHFFNPFLPFPFAKSGSEAQQQRRIAPHSPLSIAGGNRHIARRAKDHDGDLQHFTCCPPSSLSS